MNVFRLALRTLRREWHLVELRTLAASLVLAVIALGVVATLSTRIERGILASAAELIGGDLGVSAPAPLPEPMLRSARADGLAATRGASFRSVAFVGERSQLLDVLATDSAYPLRGTLEVRGADGRDRTARGPPEAKSSWTTGRWWVSASRRARRFRSVAATCMSRPNWCASPTAANCSPSRHARAR